MSDQVLPSPLDESNSSYDYSSSDYSDSDLSDAEPIAISDEQVETLVAALEYLSTKVAECLKPDPDQSPETPLVNDFLDPSTTGGFLSFIWGTARDVEPSEEIDFVAWLFLENNPNFRQEMLDSQTTSSGMVLKAEVQSSDPCRFGVLPPDKKTDLFMTLVFGRYPGRDKGSHGFLWLAGEETASGGSTPESPDTKVQLEVETKGLVSIRLKLTGESAQTKIGCS